ncbi:hypothetical protein BGZ61DRAFT_570379 [Ilyonectria robusta]|uniref:uncharacterized protein n=1 Tax=Ilyonectria robusta TaxID=1079257 RepID=UPI001E8E755B|nr:uncharacterized protein BGZ61DRAFT_570379 [Ilyonectria robusta]KAH8656376.1 hypothetical protein BGZ61DRAFT_570379 [Ilyonectria robusta]
MRRQHHSCDQCRKSKRACDAPPLGSTRRHSVSAASIGSDERPVSASRIRPCSYCLRTKKTCTMEWAQSQIHSGASLSTTSSASHRSRNPIPSKRQTTDTGNGASWATKDVDDEIDPRSASALLQDPAQIPDLVFPHLSLLDIDLSSTLPVGSLDVLEFDSILEEASQAEILGPSLDGLAAPSTCLTETVSRNASTSSDSSAPQAPKRRRRSSGWRDYQSSLSPFSIDQTMMARSNNQLISTNLLQIYHDVFEHNLSCWLTEVTCPYKTQRWSPDVVNTANLKKEWGPFWSNRIYRRTVKLDRVAQSTKMIQLVRSEDQAALRALHLAIMAFATQWAQGSRRQRQRYSAARDGADDNLAEELADEMTEEFDRNLQRHFWEQAQRALQDVSDLESYRVVCAELIFGLTQKPWANDDHPGVIDPAMFASSRGGRDVKTSALAQINRIISKEGPPTYMERAARKMHALKYRYDSTRRGLGANTNGQAGKMADSIPSMSGEDRGTIGLLYWLAVMFDTVSSSMNERPVVVADEDCQHSSVQEEIYTAEPEETSTGRWKIDVFIQDGLDEPGDFLHWPCSYEVAAEAVTKSAPIKVLLFRHVSYLQNILRKGGRGQKVEEIIRSTTSVYMYWIMTYGSFFRELVQHFDSVPPRIQSWFVCISAHWHLAALMLADIVEFVDKNGLGVNIEARCRANSKMACRIRETSVRELSDLASVATPPAEEASSAMPQLQDFHHAVNEGTILTEPWTMILIRAFSKASVILLGEADESLRYGRGTLGHNSEDFKDSLERAEECIKGLWLLGKKSDMARKIAEVLSVASDRLRR